MDTFYKETGNGASNLQLICFLAAEPGRADVFHRSGSAKEITWTCVNYTKLLLNIEPKNV